MLPGRDVAGCAVFASDGVPVLRAVRRVGGADRVVAAGVSERRLPRNSDSGVSDSDGRSEARKRRCPSRGCSVASLLGLLLTSSPSFFCSSLFVKSSMKYHWQTDSLSTSVYVPMAVGSVDQVRVCRREREREIEREWRTGAVLAHRRWSYLQGLVLLTLPLLFGHASMTSASWRRKQESDASIAQDVYMPSARPGLWQSTHLVLFATEYLPSGHLVHEALNQLAELAGVPSPLGVSAECGVKRPTVKLAA